MEFTDTHCHPFFPDLLDDLEAVLVRATAAKVKKMIAVGTSLEDSEKSIEIAGSHEQVWASIGVHPHEAQEFLDNKSRRAVMSKLLARPKVVAVGEIGLDYYKSQTPREIQETAFREQIEIGLPTGLPFIFHVRDGWSDFWRIFDEYENLNGVIHSFSSGVKQLDAAISRGLYIGLNGIMTFTKDQAQLEAARQVPSDKLLLETDAPFLTPLAFRGQVCEPKHVAATAEFLAELRAEPLEELAKTTTANAQKLFKLP
jgi:TatD DNase family protein